MESDYYDSPNKLAEDELSDDFDANAEDDDDRRGRKKKGWIICELGRSVDDYKELKEDQEEESTQEGQD